MIRWIWDSDRDGVQTSLTRFDVTGGCLNANGWQTTSDPAAGTDTAWM